MPLKNIIRFCGAYSKQNNGKPCRQPAMANGRCRMHGGKSFGPKTIEGKVRSARANYKHGLYTKEAVFERKKMRIMMNWRKKISDL